MTGERVVPPEPHEVVETGQQLVGEEVGLRRRLGETLVFCFLEFFRFRFCLCRFFCCYCCCFVIAAIPTSRLLLSPIPPQQCPKLPPPPPPPPALPPPLDDALPRPRVDVGLAAEVVDSLDPPQGVLLRDVGEQGARERHGGDGGGRQRGEDGREAVAVEVEQGGLGGGDREGRGCCRRRVFFGVSIADAELIVFVFVIGLQKALSSPQEPGRRLVFEWIIFVVVYVR